MNDIQPKRAGTGPASDPPDQDPAEVEPTDNSSGAPVNLERVEDVEQTVAEGKARDGESPAR
jgi:hypothetical protein